VVAGSTVICPHCGGAGIVRSVESTALRVLRAIEEEAEKNRAAAVTVKVASEVAIYTLNQKRRELARMEAEYGMEISFEPKEGLMGGTFEMERTRQRDPGDRPRSSAVSIEAGFVPSHEPEDDYVEEVDEPEEEEESFSEDAGAEHAQDHEAEAESRPARSDNEEQGGRRRRRRGGRGRNRDKDRGPRPEGVSQPRTPETGGDEQSEPTAASQDDHGAAPASAQPGLEGGEPRRRRRRRRGRRGGRDRQDGEPGQQVPLAPDAARFGEAPDEIDTTPREGGPALGAPSAPVWSLKDDIPDTTPSEEASKPNKKGWWQRTFSGE